MSLSEKDEPRGIKAEVIRAFANLVTLLDARFLGRASVHRALLRLIRSCVSDEEEAGSSSASGGAGLSSNDDAWLMMDEKQQKEHFDKRAGLQGQEWEEDLVDLMCHICSRVRGNPELLGAFLKAKKIRSKTKKGTSFLGAPGLRRPKSSSSATSTPASSRSPRPPSPAGSDSSTSTLRAGQSGRSSLQAPSPQPDSSQSTFSAAPSSDAPREAPQYRYSLPIFSYLLRFIHREGKVGEVARAGVLFCFNLAMGKSAFLSPSQRPGSPLPPPPPSSSPTIPTHEALLSAPDDDARSAKGSDASSAKRRRKQQQAAPVLSTREALLQLARIIERSDFALVFGASLGAVYGLLPGKLLVASTHGGGGGAGGAQAGLAVSGPSAAAPTGMSIGSGPRSEAEKRARAESLAQQGVYSSEDEFVRSQIKLLASLLDFAQDVLSAVLDDPTSHSARLTTPELAEHARELVEIGENIAADIASAVRLNFLRNILYPALLECNDADGSATAVLSYLEAMLLCIDDASPLANIIIGYLCADDANDEQAQSSGESTDTENRTRRRKSTALLRLEQGARASSRSEYFSDAHGRYTLKDLIFGHITSATQPDTLSAALRLTSTFFQRHGRFAIRHLTSPVFDGSATPFPAFAEVSLSSKGGVPLEQHFLETQLFSSLIESIEGRAGAGGSQFGFEQALHDAEEALGKDSLFALGMQICSPEQESTRHALTPLLDGLRHRIHPSDRFYRSLVKSLSAFFTRQPEVNIALTGLLSALCLCPVRSLEGWLIWPAGQVTNAQAPIVLRVLHSLVEQVKAIRARVKDFDSLLAERRSGLIFVDNLQDALMLGQDDVITLGSQGAEPGGERVEPAKVAVTIHALKSAGAELIGKVEGAPAEPVPETQPVPRAEEETASPKKRKDGFARWFGGGFRAKAHNNAADATPADKTLDGVKVAVPFAMHYSLTDNVQIELPRCVKVDAGQWSDAEAMAGARKLRFGGHSTSDHPRDDSGDISDSSSSVLYPGKEEDAEDGEMVRVSLSTVLDNVVILEETVKELAAIVQTRRNVGIDALALSR